MKILLTGKPGIGKSTVLQKVRKSYNGEKMGIISHEIRSKEGERIGFEAENLAGKKKIFAHKHLIKSDHVVGKKYFVDLEAIDNFVVPEIEKGISENALVFIDEIGRMQAFSSKFLKAIRKLLNSKSSVLGTIVYEPEQWSLEFRSHPESVLVTVNEKNRDLLPKVIAEVLSKDYLYQKLKDSQQALISEWLREYFEKHEYIQIRKLFNNAIRYVLDGKIQENKVSGSEKVYEVRGKTNNHITVFNEKKERNECDCDLYLGKSKYKGNAGECSHIQAVKLVYT